MITSFRALPAHKMQDMTVGSVEEWKARHGKGGPEREEKTELSGFENDDWKVHHGHAEAHETEAEGYLGPILQNSFTVAGQVCFK